MNIKNPLISIITVCYNSESTIEKTLQSVLNQSYKNIEYIIVDGLSSDNTLKIVKQYASLFLACGISYKIISEKDNGIYDAMNKGIQLATGEIIGMINSDDWYNENAVENVVSVYNDKGFDLFYADINIIKTNGKSFIKRAKKKRIASSRYWNHPTSFITKKTYNELGLYKCYCVYDDFDMYLRIRKAKKKIEILNQVIANFKMGGASNKKELKKAFERVKYRYWCYKNNKYCFLYFFECLLMEMAKFIIS